jgi:hypothetical protein
MAEDGVYCEPFSPLISLPTGKIQGIFWVIAQFCSREISNHPNAAIVPGLWPSQSVYRNREFVEPYQGSIPRLQGAGSSGWPRGIHPISL